MHSVNKLAVNAVNYEKVITPGGGGGGGWVLKPFNLATTGYFVEKTNCELFV